jgi:hypothetical protein
VLRQSYPNADQAQAAATAEWQRIQRQGSKFSVTLAIGDPSVYPETPVKASGWKPQIDDTDWVVEKVVHRLNEDGLTSRLEMEVVGVK